MQIDTRTSMNMQPLSSLFSHSPSFNSYSSSDKLTQIADRVVNEFQSDDDNEFQSDVDKQLVVVNNNQGYIDDEDDDDEGEFEFNLAPLSPIPADEIFSNGQIRPVYPLFNTNLVFGNEIQAGDNSIASCAVPKASQSARLPLGKLFDEERDRGDYFTSSCSSSESEDLDGVPAETYCVWTPADNSREICKKSSSTGTSKRWKLRNLLQKSNSDGKDTFAFLKTDGEATKLDRKETAPPQQQYVKKAPAKENNRNRSFLPYKKDLVELFFNVNGVSRNVHPY